jgi:hypothetical protein
MKQARFSKTMWFNGIALLLAVLIPVLEGQGFTGALPEGSEQIVLGIIAGVNLILRYFATSTALRSP